jgi:hypothetical protein
LVLQKITEQAKVISGFEALPVTAQVSMLYDLISEAQNHSVPLKMICKALNDAGSTCNVRYLREALFTVRKRHQKRGIEPGPVSPPAASHATAQPPSKSVKTESEGNSGLTPKQRRDAKADAYLADSNPLLKQFQSKE